MNSVVLFLLLGLFPLSVIAAHIDQVYPSFKIRLGPYAGYLYLPDLVTSEFTEIYRVNVRK
jgi:hypothetical protein